MPSRAGLQVRAKSWILYEASDLFNHEERFVVVTDDGLGSPSYGQGSPVGSLACRCGFNKSLAAYAVRALSEMASEFRRVRKQVIAPKTTKVSWLYIKYIMLLAFVINSSGSPP